MRIGVAVLLWVFTLAASAAALPMVWAQIHLISADGAADLARSAAADPVLQDAVAAELGAQLVEAAAEQGYGTLNPALVDTVTTSYTGNEGFPGQFAAVSRIAHSWVFTDDIQLEQGSSDRWLVDIAPMLRDPSLRASLGNLDIDVPDTLAVPVTVSDSNLVPGQLTPLATWGPWLAVGSVLLAAVAGLFTLIAAPSRGAGLIALGGGALLLGGAGWAGLAVGRDRLDGIAEQASGSARTVVEVLVSYAVASMHLWLNAALVAGAVLVALGLVTVVLTGRRVPAPGAGTRSSTPR